MLWKHRAEWRLLKDSTDRCSWKRYSPADRGREADRHADTAHTIALAPHALQTFHPVPSSEKPGRRCPSRWSGRSGGSLEKILSAETGSPRRLNGRESTRDPMSFAPEVDARLQR